MRFRSFLTLVGVAVASTATAQNDLRDIPTPDPVAEQAAMQLADGVEVNLFAGSEQIAKPIHTNFDAAGRLWVASSETYPQIEPGEVANDKIYVLEDTDGDGQCDKSTVFAAGLLIPTGVLPDLRLDGHHAAYVAASTQLLYLEDTDGDLVADKTRVIFDGFGTEDTHHLLHTLRWGPDGCVYMNQSIYIHSHVPTASGIKHLNGGGIWRYDPRRDDLRVFCKGFVNPWGHVITFYGQSFVTDGAYFDGINYAFPGAVFFSSPGAERWLKGLNPGSPKHCGLEMLPSDDDAIDLVTADFRSHRVNRFRVVKTDDGWISTPQPDLIRSDHVAFRPIDAKLGPDGYLYIADWYNPIIQHGEVDFRDDRRDRTNGRIWRVKLPAAAERDHREQPDIAQMDVAAALAELPTADTSRANWLRLRIAADENLVQTLVRWQPEGMDPFDALIHCGWLLAAGDQLDWETFSSVAQQRMTDQSSSQMPSAQQYAALLRQANYMYQQADSSQDMPRIARRIESATEHDDWLVRLEAAVFLRQILQDASSSRPEGWTADDWQSFAFSLNNLLQAPRNDALDFTLEQILREMPLEDQLLKSISSDHLTEIAQVRPDPVIIHRLQERLEKLSPEQWVVDDLTPLFASGQSEAVGQIAGQLATDLHDRGFDSATTTRLKIVAAALPQDVAVSAPLSKLLTAIVERLESSTHSPEPAIIAAASRLAAIVGDPNDQRLLSTLEKAFRETDSFEAAAAIAGALGGPRLKQSQRLRDWMNDESLPITSRMAAVITLANDDPQAAAKATVQLAESEKFQPWMMAALLRQQQPAKAIRNVLSRRERISPALATTIIAAAKSAGIDDPQWIASIRNAAGLQQEAWKYDEQLLADIRGRIEGGHSDADRGESVYRRAQLQCIACHKIGTAGNDIGPNLVSLGGSSQLDYILESLIAPNAKLKEGYQTVEVLTEDDEVIRGLEKSRTDDQLSLLLADGQLRTIDVDEIAAEKTGLSLMPTGLVDPLSRDELADLVHFLSSLGREAQYTFSPEPLVRSWQTIEGGKESDRYFNRNGIDKAADELVQQQLPWRQITTRVDGSLPLDELPKLYPHGAATTFAVLATELRCGVAGQVKIDPLDTPLAAMYLDGKPITPNTTVELSAGVHRLVVVVLRNEAGAVKVRIDTSVENGAVIDLAALMPDAISKHRVANVSVKPMSQQIGRAVRFVSSPAKAPPIDLQAGQTLAIVGDDLWERLARDGVWEATLRYALRIPNITVRHLSWAGDDVEGTAQALFGTVEEGYKRRLSEITKLNPSHVLIDFGRNEIRGGWDAQRFSRGVRRLVEDLIPSNAQIYLVAPQLPGDGYASTVQAYRKSLEQLIADLRATHKDLAIQLVELPPLTTEDIVDGFRFEADAVRRVGYRWGAAIAAVDLPPADELLAQPAFEKLVALTAAKYQSYLHAVRPQNETYLLLFRKHEQGQNAVELQKWTEMAKDLDAQIDQELAAMGE